MPVDWPMDISDNKFSRAGKRPMIQEINDENAALAPPSGLTQGGILWARGLVALPLCWFAWRYVFPKSPPLGLALLGIGVLMVGSAFGRE
jgi:hypothetical protein